MGLIKKTVQDQLGQSPAAFEQANASETRSFASLVAELASDRIDRRRAAAMELAAHDAAEVLGQTLANEWDASVREAMITSLAAIASDGAADYLALGLRSENASVRNECIDALRAMPEQCERLMPALLADPDSDIRIFAVNILETLRHANVESWLITILERDTEVNVCGAALDVLTEVGTPGALAVIAAVAERFADEPFIQFGAALAQERIQGVTP